MPQKFQAPQFVEDADLLDDFEKAIKGDEETPYEVKTFMGLNNPQGDANFNVPVTLEAACLMRKEPLDDEPLKKFLLVAVSVDGNRATTVRAYEDIQQGEGDYAKLRSTLKAIVSVLNDTFPRPADPNETYAPQEPESQDATLSADTTAPLA